MAEIIIIAALLLDLIIGDPRWFPHPVRAIGLYASFIEHLMRTIFGKYLRFAGILAALLIIGTCCIFSWSLIFFISKVTIYAGYIVSALLIYFSIAPRDLYNHSMAVYKALKSGDISEARTKVSMIVGRDIDREKEEGIVRASVETVAESLVDGVTAPLFYAFVFGPVGAFAYRAINTLDSMFGHKNEKYLHFGWASARIDDITNYIPARITAPFIFLAAFILKYNYKGSVKIFVRDGRKHQSPNSGLSEAAFAGALKVQLGGLNYYNGIPDSKPLIGDAIQPLTIDTIKRANILMIFTTLCFSLAGILITWIF
jgi:adenosylcobinamide-phosphate synthase